VPEVPVPIALAALSSGSIRLAGELADAWAPFLWARSRVQDGRALLQEGESVGMAGAPTSVRACVPVALGPDEASARALAAWWLATYTTRMGPLYPRLLAERFGMSVAVEAIVRGAQGDGPPELPAIAENLARDVTLMGTYEEAPALIDAWFAAGADSVQLVLPPGRLADELTEVVDAAAKAQTPGAAGRERTRRRATTAPPAAATT
jgi:alkanesulfonate monooxygenase SsuD/methylene tetrahydromethanopterin reductase-like flavin-dependent oxidoreductase (luciferase family)